MLLARSLCKKKSFGRALFHHKPKDAVLTDYTNKVTSGVLREDKRQREAVLQLNDLGNRLLSHKLPEPTPTEIPKKGISGWFAKLTQAPKQEVPRGPVPKGLYMFGGVGTGKTMLMDLFLNALELRKSGNRVHFNQFMHGVHMRIHSLRSDETLKNANALDVIADEIVSISHLLCFDEFQVTNIADAMLLGRLFAALWKRGVVVVATSNRVPEELYKGGLQRDLFLPFISRLREHCQVYCLDSHKDYRLTGLKIDKIYIVGTTEGKLQLDKIWNDLTENREGTPYALTSLGRKIHIPKQVKGIARVSFSDLCELPLGGADYSALASKFHTVLMDDIPQFNKNMINEGRRFITLVDELYEHKVKFLCSAVTEPKDLFAFEASSSSKGSSAIGEEEAFAFRRTASRLSEMQTTSYLEQPHQKTLHQS